jgi:hypothetical protein
MYRPGLATDPVGLTAVICAFVFLVAATALARYAYRYMVFLGLITFNAVVLCQYQCAACPLLVSFMIVLGAQLRHSVLEDQNEAGSAREGLCAVLP